jgi:nucleotide-binding universal stress UspA family protein
MAIKTVLLPVDGSSCSEAAIPLAKDMASSTGARLVLMTVGNLAETATMAQEERGELLALLDRTAKEFDLTGDRRIEMGGDAAEGILTVADEEDADLIVMSTHGRSGLSELTHGSVAGGVVRDGRKPVLLVRPKDETR